MKHFLIMAAFAFFGWQANAQTVVGGTIRDAADGHPLTGVTLKLKRAHLTLKSDSNGHFRMSLQRPDTLMVSYVGYTSQSVAVGPDQKDLTIMLDRSDNVLETVEISTGYYRLPKERATGSFVHIDNQLLNRSMGGNVLQRLEGIAPGVQFVNSGGTTAADIRVRGLSTIESDETPLIILDNFPYEGSLDNIDPDDIESITVLKDAAAASIWGARAGNGVMVITSKKAAQDGRVHISLNANTNITEKPDLLYSKSWLPSATVMEIEKKRYELGHYTFNERTPVPLYVEWLRAFDEGLISAPQLEEQERVMRNTDARRQAMDYLYRGGGFRQYTLNVSGGAERYGYEISGAYYNNLDNLVGNNSKRYNLGVRNRFKPYDGMEISVGIAYVGHQSVNNGVDYSSLSVPNVGISPYMRLMDENGNPLPVVKGIRFGYAEQAEANGLLDWLYRPVEERNLIDNTARSNELRLNSEWTAKLWKGFSASAIYQYVRGNEQSQFHYHKDSYFVRDLVNAFTQPNGNSIVPNNGILLTGNPAERFSHFGRTQVDYQATYHVQHSISALVGAEIRHSQQEVLPGTILYNYDDNYLTGSAQFNYNELYPTLPAGSPNRRLQGPSSVRRFLVNRDLSYYANASYVYANRYMLSGSLRWDGSNLFGVKANQKGVPLWSVGGGWELSREGFYPWAVWLPYVRLRATYGISGNVNKRVTHFPTVRYGTTPVGLTAAMITSVGNPSLQWERVSTANFALEWRSANNRLTGSVEKFTKQGSDLIGDEFMDPTTGITGSYKINYASIRTSGWDIQLNSRNTTGRVGWNTTLLMSWVDNEVTHYNGNETLATYRYLASSKPPVVHTSRDLVYALPWYGLSPENGYPIAYLDGQPTDDYRTYYNQLILDDLVSAGVTVPPFYGSLRNDLSYANLNIGVLLTWKSGYVFRRSSFYPGGEFTGNFHEDYFRRWAKPGDELHTDVPAYLPLEAIGSGNYMATVYSESEALITKGDHIRIQDVNLSYTLPKRITENLNMQSIRISAYARNLGILWKANKQGIDPDYVNALYGAPRSYSLGLNVTF
ncbi:SusC/RagA family TonB-linked outer membrane protein [Parapedobacter defluvii]|uniref:SusC/RagA family TonB-linked outer membrane protein n=1 Tax=Parapedobacter defluvii TaxID=2045106 RepID=A0ABQ1KZS5_9SPHI|nr:SusC/RagA family TonB-linked outer membrane protein [Parapedobacter defluvii]GGC14675.1 SusC/RagA family TonB-linked outer membrane protein [Parapedobacter defluvii]